MAILNSLVIVYGIAWFTTISHTFPIMDVEDAALYLEKYGYIESYTPGSMIDHESFSASIRDFQRFMGLNTTGELDSETVTIMNLPRCGVKDIFRSSENSRKKRYAIEGEKWDTKILSYHISSFPDTITDRATVRSEIARAFKIWSDVTTLTFEEKDEEEAIMDISFERRDHDCVSLFDGRGRTFAHAFFPQDGDIHFDDDEAWTINGRGGVDLLQVAVHEIGHSLGLNHSNVTDAIMFPTYSRYKPGLQLHADDIAGIQYLYGEPTDTPPDLCEDASIDTIVRTKNGNTYVFKGDYYWKVVFYGLARGYPRKIVDDWHGLEGNLDASFTQSDGKTYFFKGGKCWKFINKRMVSGYPQLITTEFPGIPNMLDAAVVRYKKIYFFKGKRFWRFDRARYPHVSSAYPVPIGIWDDALSDGIDAAFVWENNSTYFFKDDQYYKYNYETSDIDVIYPLPTGPWWFICKSNSSEEFQEVLSL